MLYSEHCLAASDDKGLNSDIFFEYIASRLIALSLGVYASPFPPPPTVDKTAFPAITWPFSIDLLRCHPAGTPETFFTHVDIVSSKLYADKIVS